MAIKKKGTGREGRCRGTILSVIEYELENGYKSHIHTCKQLVWLMPKSSVPSRHSDMARMQQLKPKQGFFGPESLQALKWPSGSQRDRCCDLCNANLAYLFNRAYLLTELDYCSTDNRTEGDSVKGKKKGCRKRGGWELGGHIQRSIQTSMVGLQVWILLFGFHRVWPPVILSRRWSPVRWI